MLYLIHGDNQVTSRNRLSQLKQSAQKQNKEIINLLGTKLTLEQLIPALEASSMFGQEKLVIIEEIFGRLESLEKKAIVKYLKTNTIITELIIWEKKLVSGLVLRWLPKNWQIEVFKTSPIIFQLLDNIKPKNTKIMINLLQQAQTKDAVELIFYLLARRIRQLIIAATEGKTALKGAPWQIAKLLAQAKNFSLKQLVELYNQLLAIDWQIKSGQTLMPLSWHLDLLLLNL